MTPSVNLQKMLAAHGREDGQYTALLIRVQPTGRVREMEHQAEMLKLQNRLDEFLKQTIDIERQFLTASSPARLQELRDAVSRVKLQALEELPHEDLRGDRLFSIFLLQCGNLSQAMQGQLWLQRAEAPAD